MGPSNPFKSLLLQVNHIVKIPILWFRLLNYCVTIGSLQCFPLISDPNSYALVCDNCACGGSINIDWMLVSTNQYSVDKCFDDSKANNFCGKMIVMGDGDCYCMGVGKEDSCSMILEPSWKVYMEPTGKPEYQTKEENS